jgi:dGTPase
MALDEILPEGFRHNEQSLRVVEVLEGGKGLNLTREVCDGILHHTGGGMPLTLEGQIVRNADRIAYINHDIDDALRSGVLKPGDIPRGPLAVLGTTHSQRIDTMVRDMIEESRDKPKVAMSPVVQAATDELRSFMFDHVYIGSMAKTEEEKARHLVRSVYSFLMENPEHLPPENRQMVDVDGLSRAVVDFVAGMTDRYAMRFYTENFIPSPWVQM